MKSKFMALFQTELRLLLLHPGFFISIAFAWFLTSWIFGLVLKQTSQASLMAPIWWMGLISLILAPLFCMNAFEKHSSRGRFSWIRSHHLHPLGLVLIPFLIQMVHFLAMNSLLFLHLYWLQKVALPDLSLSLASLLALFVLQATLVSQNLLVSSVTTSPLKAVTAATAWNWCTFALMHASRLGSAAKGPDILVAFSSFGSFQNCLGGQATPQDLVFPLMSIPVALILTTLVMRR